MPEVLRRLSQGDEGESRYVHPNGWVIVYAKRSWDERTGRIQGQCDGPPPRGWWEVSRHYSQIRADALPVGRCLRDFPTLREARTWCDGHVPDMKGRPRVR